MSNYKPLFDKIAALQAENNELKQRIQSSNGGEFRQLSIETEASINARTLAAENRMKEVLARCAELEKRVAAGGAVRGAAAVPAGPSQSNGPSETSLDYWNGTYVFTSRGKLVSTVQDEKTKEEGLILHATIFHPQGGGQPSDVGVIKNKSGAAFTVSKVKKVGPEVIHSGKYENEKRFSVGEELDLSIDENTRRLHARLHSGGHLLDVAVQKAGFSFKPTKGNHAQDGPFVEYEGDLSAEEKDSFVSRVQAQVTQLIEAKLPLSVGIIPYSQLSGNLGGYVPPYLAKDQPARVVRIQGADGCPCGGTHVENTSEIGSLTIIKLDKKGKTIKVKYSIN